ncbi:hypothetical protein J2X16_002523 [Pelomonas aquatica]|uniref:Cytochrome-c oxidase n=1 Tax=Pelomonas aquatica TaxID=431058 RepID=A0ABU1Z978_9BURK|nr:hypothetical protein [Pelomonas aquatica]MDR7297176.1 hypothetical protein [Pelomonas aquatica]
MNSNKRYGAWWLRMAAVYLVVGVSLGNYMGATHDFGLRSVHAHVNLLGWASMLGFGLVAQQWADTLSPRLVALQFWLHQLALPAMLSALAALMRGVTAAEPLVGLGSAVVGLAVLAFAANVWLGTGAKLRAA